jgi:hypothetical protein
MNATPSKEQLECTAIGAAILVAVYVLAAIYL